MTPAQAMADDECDHGSDPRTCPVCLGPAPEPPRETSWTFVARFGGDCDECLFAIEVGQAIRRVDGRYVHDHCAQEMPR